MRGACEALRTLGDDGVVGGENAGRRFREVMNKTGVWDADAVPVEYARCLTDWPSRAGWDHAWKRTQL
jgi:large subunit ribosomal protein L40